MKILDVAIVLYSFIYRKQTKRVHVLRTTEITRVIMGWSAAAVTRLTVSD